MNALPDSVGSPHTLGRLAEFLRDNGSQLTLAEASTLAINDWIATQRGQLTALAPTPARGYQWKALFLPEGTQLRVNFAGQSCYAWVEGDDIIYEGRRVSPRQLTIAAAGDGHNAWRDIWVLLPGAPRWHPASVLRRQAEQETAAKPVSPVEAMTAAAACMSETLKTALALVEHANAQSLPKFERRAERKRRTQDVLEETCQFD